jgi:hypothetical protein
MKKNVDFSIVIFPIRHCLNLLTGFIILFSWVHKKCFNHIHSPFIFALFLPLVPPSPNSRRFLHPWVFLGFYFSAALSWNSGNQADALALGLLRHPTGDLEPRGSTFSTCGGPTGHILIAPIHQLGFDAASKPEQNAHGTTRRQIQTRLILNPILMSLERGTGLGEVLKGVCLGEDTLKCYERIRKASSFQISL